MTLLSDYFEKKRGILWAVLTIILFLFAFGGFDLLFKLKIGELMRVPITQLTFLMLIIAFVIVLVVGLIIWVFSVLKTQQTAKIARSWEYEAD
jgi:hypothetical protein